MPCVSPWQSSLCRVAARATPPSRRCARPFTSDRWQAIAPTAPEPIVRLAKKGLISFRVSGCRPASVRSVCSTSGRPFSPGHDHRALDLARLDHRAGDREHALRKPRQAFDTSKICARVRQSDLAVGERRGRRLQHVAAHGGVDEQLDLLRAQRRLREHGAAGGGAGIGWHACPRATCAARGCRSSVRVGRRASFSRS